MKERDIAIDGISEGSSYTYGELCEILGETRKTGNSKRSQLRRWSSMFDWSNPTNRIFHVTKILERKSPISDGRSGNGGKREGSGRKPAVSEEFEVLMNAFLGREFSRNVYNASPDICDIHFTGYDIGLYFGLHNDEFYRSYRNIDTISSMTGLSETALRDAWRGISRKLMEKRRSWIYGNISRRNDIELSDGVVAYTSTRTGEFSYKDELSNLWDEYMREFIRLNKLGSIAGVLEGDRWSEMVSFISSQFPNYERVEKVKRISFHSYGLRSYDMGDVESARASFNEKVVESVSSYFSKRTEPCDMVPYETMIDMCVKL